MIRVCLADDHALFRAGLVALLEGTREVTVIGQADNGDDAVELCASLEPEVLLVDVEMPGPGTSTVLARVRRRAPTTHSVVVSMHADHLLARQWRRAGADAVLPKSADVQELVSVLRQVVAAPIRVNTAETGRLDVLTARQTELLHYVARGYTNPEIAEALSLSPSTVKRHLANIQAALGSSSRLDSVRRAQILGFLDERPAAFS